MRNDYNFSEAVSTQVYVNMDLGNSILFKVYMLLHPGISEREAVTRSGIFKERLIKPRKIENGPTTAAAFVLHTEAEKNLIIELFKKEVAPKVTEWFKQELSENFIVELTKYREQLKQDISNYDELDFSVHNLDYYGIENDESIDVRDTAARAMVEIITGTIDVCINTAKTITGQKQVEEAQQVVQEAQEAAQENFQQTVQEAQEAAQEAAKTSVLPRPLVVHDPNPVPTFTDAEINKHFTFSKFCRIPVEQHEDFRKVLLSVMPEFEAQLVKRTGKPNHTFKLVQYWNPHMFMALKVNKKGEFIIGKDAILLSVYPTLQGPVAVITHDYDSIHKNVNEEFFIEHFGADACKKATANDAQLRNMIYDPDPDKIVTEEQFLALQYQAMQHAALEQKAAQMVQQPPVQQVAVQ